MERIVLFDGEEFEARYFLDVDEDFEGVDIYRISYTNEGDEQKVNKTHIGFIDDISFPDEDDNEQIDNFEKIVTEWLYKQDVNYLLG